ncbi:MAG TPA: hypothetical protein VKR58_02470 [Aquella sp.]|nr:hypothetical protein [Aquella sp.]
MIKRAILFIPLLLSACFNAVDNNISSAPDLSRAVIQTTPKNINLVIDTKSPNLSRAKQTITFTNVGLQPATQLLIKGFKDESAPLVQNSTCDKDLAAGGSCLVTIELKTSHKFAESGPISNSTVMNYEYNDSSEKKSQEFGVSFKVEKWVASVFLTNTRFSGKIEYPKTDGLLTDKAGAGSADHYCRMDKNNPQNGYEYQALMYDTRERTPYLRWVLVGGQTYYSVMPNVYHQKVWDTSYKQATAVNLLSNIYNCIGTNCINQAIGDEAAWTGLQLNGDSIYNIDNCGTAGNAWKSETKNFHGRTLLLKPVQNSHLVTMTNDDASCDMYKKIICVSK